MSKPVVVDLPLITNYIVTKNYLLLADYLKNNFKVERNEAGAPFLYELSPEVIIILQKILQQINKEDINDTHEQILKELFRCLRNYVVNPDVQNCIVNNTTFLDDVKNLLHIINTEGNNLLQVIVQFLINLVISNEHATVTVYDGFFDQILFYLKGNICVYENTALLYNISIYKELVLDLNTYRFILELYNSNENVEFIDFLMEKFVTYNHFWDSYEKFDLNSRMLILNLIKNKQIKGDLLNVPESGIKTLTHHFITSGDVIFQTVSSSTSSLEPYEISHLLQVISAFCGSENYLQILQKDKDLLITTGVLLINIHRLGKEEQNCFSSIQSLSAIREPTESICEHPAFGFKADLIRIIGNLCWKNKTMQDLVREAELIPVILDCCNMDARNPFIMQWVILAVRNLCENNKENQKLIADMHVQGAVTSSVLEEMGITLHSDTENTVKIIPMEALRNKK